jgi:hypothetical protein
LDRFATRLRIDPRIAAATAALSLLVALAAPPAAAQRPQYNGIGFGKNKVQYRDFDWQIYHSPHFDVYYYTAEEVLLEKVVSFAESAYDRLSREFDFQIQQPTPLIFYANHASFEQNNIILNFIPEGVGAFATPARFRMVLPVDLPDPELMGLILHELTHIFQYHILFQGNLGKAIATRPPTWLMEGMASYKAQDETTKDKMVLIDAVVNDQIPPMTQGDFGGFFAYRIGHAAFDYIEETYGQEGFRDFLFEFRNTIGSQVDRAVERAFNVDPEDFDADFRRWLRRKYLPELLRTGEPRDFGRPFKVERGLPSQELSPSASPSGDLIAAFSTEKGDLDISLFDAENRRLIRNLTKGFSNEYQYLVGQWLTTGPQMGRDLAFSPDGNTIAVFAKRERGRSLLLIDVLGGGIHKKIDIDEVDQELAPAWSPDGTRVAFAANEGGRFDIFTVEVATGELNRVTDDDLYDGAPVFSPDGEALVFSSVLGDGYAKLFRIALDDPSRRFQLTFGESNDIDAVFSPSGRRLYFTSDRTGAENIHGLDLETGELRQYTNAVTGCFTPTPLARADGTERLVYTALFKGRFDLYVTDVDEPVGESGTSELRNEPMLAENLPRYEPDIQVPTDDSNKEKYSGFKLFLEDADSFIGVNDDQTLVGQIVLSWSDYLGDRRLFTSFTSVDSFSNFDVVYLNLSNRLQWQVHLFDDRDFYLVRDNSFGDVERGRASFKQTGAIASLIYPFTFHQRFEVGAGYLVREFDQQVLLPNGQIGVIGEVKDDFPLVQAALVGDSTVFSSYGPVAGRRWRLDTFYAPDLDDSGALATFADLDIRQYIPLTRRSLVALRAFAAVSEGNRPSPVYFGGLDTVRGFRYRELAGDRGFFTNIELRFPLIDVLATPILGFQGIRGVIFLDVGGAWFSDFEEFDFLADGENRLQDGVASYGYGITVRFLGIDLNWDVAQRWDFKDNIDDTRTSFWIGTRF